MRFCADPAKVCGKLLPDKDLLLIERWSWRGLAGALALVASGAAVSAVGLAASPQEPAGAGGASPAAEASRGSQLPLPQLPVTRLDDRKPPAELDGPRSVSLTLAQPLPLRDMLLLLVRGTAFSLVADDRVDGTFSGELKNLTMRQALEAVLFPRDLDYDVQGTLIRVFPRKPATRLFDVNYLNVRRSVERTTGGTAHVGRGPDLRVTTSSDADLFDELERGVERMLSPGGRAHVDRVAGLVQVTDFTDRLDQIAVYIEAVQLRATRQVRLDARVLEVTLNSAARPVNWTAVAAGAGVGSAAPGAAGIQVRDFDALLNAIATQGTVRLIAAPRLLAMNNEPAVLRIGTEGVHFVPLAGAGAEAQPAPSTALEGLTLIVTAQIAADGIVQLHVAPTYAEASGQAKGPQSAAAPVLDVSEADTLVRVRDGETVILSGFLKEGTRTIPGTGFAGFFGAESHQAVRNELVILLTPTVVAPGTVPASESK